MDHACLAPRLHELSGIRDRLRATVHVAPTARREPDSGLGARLKYAERA